MKKLSLILVSVFLLTILFVNVGCVRKKRVRHRSPAISTEYHKAQQESWNAQTAGDKERQIQILLDFKNKYEDRLISQGLKLTQLRVIKLLASAYRLKPDYDQALMHARQGLQLIEEINQIGLLNLDDTGSGQKLSQAQNIRRASAAERMWLFQNDQIIIYSVLANCYRAAGESDKAEKAEKNLVIARKEAAEYQQKATQETTKKRAAELKKQGYSDAKAKNQAKQENEIHQKENQKLKLQARAAALEGKILKKYHSKDTLGLDEMIDQWVALFISFDPWLHLAKQNYNIYKSQGNQAVAADIDRFINYYSRDVLTPWGKALKASMLHKLGRSDEAELLLEHACLAFANREKLKYNTKNGAYVASGPEYNPVFKSEKPPLAWRILRADILTSLGSEHAPALWRDIKTELSVTPSDPQTAAFQFMNRLLYSHMGDIELAQYYEEKGDRAKARSHLEKILAERESSRSTFSTEAHKMNYLAANKHLYERFLELSSYHPEPNLLAMERAKSRGMVDLMAQGIGSINEPVLKMAAEQRKTTAESATLQPGVSVTRAINVVPQELSNGLRKLKHTQPELHSLVAVDVPNLEDIERMIPDNTAVLSYYLSDDALYINLFSKNQKTVKVNKTSRMGLYDSVYRFRRQIQGKSSDEPRKAAAGITLNWDLANNRDALVIKNNLPIPLEIISVTRVDRFANHGVGVFPNLNFVPPLESSEKPLHRSVEPGGSQTIVSHDRSGARANSFIEEMLIDTNLGLLTAKALFIQSEEGNVSFTLLEQSGLAFEPLKNSLYDTLIKPVQTYIKARHLIIVPHNVLHFLPFEALKDDQGKYLVEKYAISYVPSLNVLKYCKSKNSGLKQDLVAYGDPLGDLKYARNEVKKLQTLFARSKVLIGTEVTPESIRASIAEGDVVHFACHGVYDPVRPLDSALIVTGSNGKACPLTVTEIMGMKFTPYLVTLSACDTGLARLSGGDELIGLVRGFFVAGAPSLLTTLWPIDDAPTSLLMNRFYENLTRKNMNKASALRKAKLDLIAQGHADPYLWSAFVLQGDWL